MLFLLSWSHASKTQAVKPLSLTPCVYCFSYQFSEKIYRSPHSPLLHIHLRCLLSKERQLRLCQWPFLWIYLRPFPFTQLVTQSVHVKFLKQDSPIFALLFPELRKAGERHQKGSWICSSLLGWLDFPPGQEAAGLRPDKCHHSAGLREHGAVHWTLLRLNFEQSSTSATNSGKSKFDQNNRNGIETSLKWSRLSVIFHAWYDKGFE